MPHWPKRSQCYEHKSNSYKQAKHKPHWSENSEIMIINQNILWKSHVVTTKGKINMPHWPERFQCHEHKSNNYKQANTSLTGQNIPKITIDNQKILKCLTDQNILNINSNNRQAHALLAITFWPQPTIGHGTETSFGYNTAPSRQRRKRKYAKAQFTSSFSSAVSCPACPAAAICPTCLAAGNGPACLAAAACPTCPTAGKCPTCPAAAICPTCPADGRGPSALTAAPAPAWRGTGLAPSCGIWTSPAAGWGIVRKSLFAGNSWDIKEGFHLPHWRWSVNERRGSVSQYLLYPLRFAVLKSLATKFYSEHDQTKGIV